MTALSFGVNKVNELFEKIAPKLVDYCTKNKRVKFVFNSLMFTRHQWLNKECAKFNDLVFSLSCGIDNLFFFDSESLITNSNLKSDINKVIPRTDRRGVHLSWNAVSIIRQSLLTAVGVLASKMSPSTLSTTPRGWKWPLARSRADGVSWLRSKFGKDFVNDNKYRRFAQ